MTGPIDPQAGARFALEGRVVTMDEKLTVHPHARVYVDQGDIVAVVPVADGPPAGLEDAPVAKVTGTIYPGLIELHNHLSYNALPLWQVPERYTNRDSWQRGPAYRPLISGPMKVIGTTKRYVPALVRYVEAKALLGGTTTSQGVMLFSFSGIVTYYAGIIRNVERTLDPELPASTGHVGDVAATSAAKFLQALEHGTRYLLHLSEGTDAAARQHFLDLEVKKDTWAINANLAGIHCVALTRADFKVLAGHGGSMVWSPLSNLLLYGQTADVAAAKAEHVLIGLGSDWSPSGSKNLLGELKVARLVSAHADAGPVFSDAELLALATTNAAKILGWERALGSLEPKKRADLLVIAGDERDPYAQLLEADERDVALVVIGGVARYGRKRLMQQLAAEPHTGLEPVQVGDSERLLDLRQTTEFPAVAKLSLGQATDMMREGLARLPELAKELEQLPVAALLAPDPDQFFLVLDHDEPPGIAIRPHLSAAAGGSAALEAAAQKPLSEVVKPVKLDPLTSVDDGDWNASLMAQRNLPDYLKQ